MNVSQAPACRTCHAFSLQNRLLRLNTTDAKPRMKEVERMDLTTCDTVAWAAVTCHTRHAV